MAHIEQELFLFGKTVRVKTGVLKAKAHEFEPPDDGYTHQSIKGIDEIAYDTNVGIGEPHWVPLEKGTDLGADFKEKKALKKENSQLKMQNGKLKKKLQSLGFLTEAMEQEATDA